MKKKIVVLNTPVPFECLKDKFIEDIKNIDNEQLLIKTKDGQEYKMYHSQDCCESVYIEDIIGADLKDLIGHRVIAAEEIDGANTPPPEYDDYTDSYTWTFYRLITTGGMVVIRWYGSSNGCYSESVDFIRTK